MDIWLRGVGGQLAGAGQAIHDSLNVFGQNAGPVLESWGQGIVQNLDPNHPVHIAMTQAGQLSGAVAADTLRHLGIFGKQMETLISAVYNELHKHASAVEWHKLSIEVKTWVERTAPQLEIAVSDAAKAVVSIAQSQLPVEIVRWITEHPGQTVFIIVAGIVFFAPFLITVPVLYTLGFRSSGVVAGSAAAALHSIIGPIAAGSIFALLQSAGTGGAGLAVINTLMSTGAGVGLGLGAIPAMGNE